jgi:hypothetical protein
MFSEKNILEQMLLEQMLLEQMLLEQMLLEQMLLEQMLLEQILSIGSSQSVLIGWGGLRPSGLCSKEGVRWGVSTPEICNVAKCKSVQDRTYFLKIFIVIHFH